jgi:hypothetical protein
MFTSPASSSSEVKDSQWFAYWAGIHAAVQHWANGTPLDCPYPVPKEIEERLAEWMKTE